MSTLESFVKFEKVDKSYDGEVLVVTDLNLNIPKGEFLTMLGPSGSGKTTTLMMIAGFETPTNGEIYLDGEAISNIPPYKRGIGMVFQNYALFPHMTVNENLAFPLEVRKLNKSDIKDKVAKALSMVELGDFGNRMPLQLSGGQQQRVALARALVFEPRLVLMDEPLGTLDAEFRELMCLELRKLHNNINATTVYVTHDQLEAMSMGDRIAVMNEGKIIQSGPPKEVYSKPKSKFVGSFIGSPAMNFIPINEGIKSGQQNVKIGNIEFAIPKQYQDTNSNNNHLGIRPEKMYLSDDKGIEGKVYGSEYLGTRKILTIQSFFGNFKIRVSNDLNANLGSNVKVNFESKSAIIFDGKTENALKSGFIN